MYSLSISLSVFAAFSPSRTWTSAGPPGKLRGDVGDAIRTRKDNLILILREKSSDFFDQRWRTHGTSRTYDFAPHGALGSFKHQADFCKDCSCLGSFQEPPSGQHPDQPHREASKDCPAGSMKWVDCLAGLPLHGILSHPTNRARSEQAQLSGHEN